MDIINEMRDDYQPNIRHNHLIDKIKKVLGEAAPTFRSGYFDSMNRKQSCYYLPKREASLMVMSESYAVQAKVYDRNAQDPHRVNKNENKFPLS